MDSQQRFEGPDLQELLTQVQRELGPEAEILEANKLRSGGVGGFFARERFEVIVAVPERLVAKAEALATAQASAEALQSAMDGAGTTPGPRRITTTPKVWTNPNATTPTTPAETKLEDRPASHLEEAVMAAMAAADSEPSPSAAMSILELAEQRNQEERVIQRSTPEAPVVAPSTPAAAPTVSTEGPAFAEVLGKLAREALSQNDLGTDSDETFVPLATEAQMLTTEPVPAMPVTPAPVMTPAAMPTATMEPAAPAMPTPMAPVNHPAPLSPVSAALACLGLPEHLLPSTHALSDLRNDLMAALRWLPAPDPLPTGSGSVIAVVGNAEHAMEMAQQLAQELGCDEREIVVAGEAADNETPSWMQLQDLAEATERRRSWRRRTTPTVVAVAAPFGYDPAAWARPMLDALEPTIAWGVVSADRKAEDVRAWIDRLGGVDAIAVTDTALTVSPATMLQLGIPVARLDGERADPIRWANLLLGRLAA